MTDKFVCGNPNDACYGNKCEDCKDAKTLKQFVLINSSTIDMESSVNWTQWTKITKKNRTEEDNAHIQIKKEENTSKLSFFLDRLYLLIPNFVWHIRVMKNQQKAYGKSRERACLPESNIMMLHVDFAENIKCFGQDQPQAAHFSQAQVSIFTCALWHRGSCVTKAITSDVTKHDKNFVVPVLEKLCSELPTTAQQLEIFSDNARSQFKSKFVI